MKIEYKIFRIILFIILSVPFFLVSLLLVQAKYEEVFVYGKITKAKIVDIRYENGGSEGYGTDIFFNLQANKNIYKSIITYTDYSELNKNEANFLENVKIKDEVTIKVINPYNAKILSWNNLVINRDGFSFGL